MNWTQRTVDAASTGWRRVGGRWPDRGTFIIVVIILTLGFYLIFPVTLILALSFNVTPEFFSLERRWGLDNWRVAFANPAIIQALWNTVWLFLVSQAVSLPLSVVVAWLLARTKLPGSNILELLYWVSYVTPGGLIAWIMLLDPNVGIANTILELLPFVDKGPFNIFSIPGIIFVNIVGGASATSVMILTPIFRNMDAAMEEAARVSGASSLGTMMRVTVPIMVSPIVLLFALQLMRMFQSFERELILGTPIGFFVYSTLIFDQVRLHEPPRYGQAIALASMTLLLIAIIIPLQRWILTRRRYTTITGNFRQGLADLGHWKWFAFAFVISDHVISLFTLLVMVGGSFMTRVGLFMLNPVFTTAHWEFVLDSGLFYDGLKTTLVLAITAGILSPLLFSALAYIIVRTRWRFRYTLDSLIWVLRGNSRHPRRPGTAADVPMDSRPELALRYHLGPDYRGRHSGAYERSQPHEGKHRSGGLRSGGRCASLGLGMAWDLLQGLAAAHGPVFGAHRPAQLQYRCWHHCERRLARIQRDEHVIAADPGMADALDRSQRGGRRRPDHLGRDYDCNTDSCASCGG